MHDVPREQLAVAGEFLRVAPIATVVVWAVNAGAALQKVVVPFFLLGLGLNPVQLGTIALVKDVGSLALSPLYGWLLDVRGPWPALTLSLSLCGLGCGIRALATGYHSAMFAAAILAFGGAFETVTLAHLSACFPPSRRTHVVSGYLAQLRAIVLAGQLLYAPWSAALRLADAGGTVFRHRLTMGGCVLPCLVGFCAFVLGARRPEWSAHRVIAHVTPSTAPAATSSAGAEAGRPSRRARGGPQRCAAAAGPFAVALLALAATAAASAGLNTLWPVIVRECYGWDADEFAPALFGASVVALCAISAAPRIAARALGLGGTAVCALLVAAAAALLGFVGVGAARASAHPTERSCAEVGVGLNVAAGLALSAATALAEPSLKALVSLLAPRALGGRVFGLMTSAGGVGAMAANALLPRMYTHYGSSRAPFGALAIVSLGAALTVAAFGLDGADGWHSAEGGAWRLEAVPPGEYALQGGGAGESDEDGSSRGSTADGGGRAQRADREDAEDAALLSSAADQEAREAESDIERVGLLATLDAAGSAAAVGRQDEERELARIRAHHHQHQLHQHYHHQHHSDTVAHPVPQPPAATARRQWR